MSQPRCSSPSTRAHVPSADHRRCRLYTVFQHLYDSGRSRHGEPVRVRHNTPLTTVRWSFQGRDRRGVRSGNSGSSRAHSTSVKSWRSCTRPAYRTPPESVTGHALVGVFGNNDGPELRRRLPEVAQATVAGLRIAVIHETGAAKGREERCDARFPDTDVLVFGHSHIPWDTTTPGGLRLLNPGSPTDRRRQPYCTYLTAVAQAGRLVEVTLHRLPPRAGGASR